MAEPGQRKTAIPLCLPNNCDWKSGKCTKNGKERTSLYVIDEALEELRRIKGPVCVVSIAGTYRKGKSYILSEAFDQPNVFTLGHEMEPETMGIWLWVVPDKYKDSHGREFTVVLLDSEGIDSLSNKGFEDHRIFTLTVLLASVFIYNSQGVPLRKDVEKLDFIAKLSKRIHIRSRPGLAYCTADKETELFHKTFPYFIWLLRDVTQSIPDDCENIKDYFLKKVFNVKASVNTSHRCSKVCESILRFFSGFDAFMLPSPSVDPEIIRCINEKKCQVNRSFIYALDEFKNLIKTTLAPKHSPTDGEFVTGQGLAALVQLYVNDINTSGAIPNVQSTWDTYVEEKCREAKQTALGLYDDRLLEAQLSLSADELPCDNDYIRSSHTAALQECEHKFLSELDGFATDIVEKHMGELKVSIESKLREWDAENKRQTRQWCEGLISVFKAKHFDPVLKRLQEKDAAEVSFKDVIDGYNKIKDDYHSSAGGARDVIATVFFEFHPKLKKEMDQQLALLGQLKDFDEKLSRELAAKAYLESERKRLEEEQRRLQQENSQQKRQMEILINSLGDERKRFQEQLKDEQQAQQQQLQNMVAASINQAHEERQEFIKQRRYLNAQLKEIQEYNEQNMKKIKEMSEIAARHEKEKEELLQQVNSETDEEREALIMEMNDRHEQEMRVFRDEMNGKLNEVLANAPTIDKDMFRTPGLIKERTKAADDLRSKTKQTQKARQEVEKPGVLKTVMEFVSGVIPAVGAVVGASCPVVAPIVVPIFSLVGAGAGFLAKNICSIM